MGRSVFTLLETDACLSSLKARATVHLLPSTSQAAGMADERRRSNVDMAISFSRIIYSEPTTAFTKSCQSRCSRAGGEALNGITVIGSAGITACSVSADQNAPDSSGFTCIFNADSGTPLRQVSYLGQIVQSSPECDTAGISVKSGLCTAT